MEMMKCVIIVCDLSLKHTKNIKKLFFPHPEKINWSLATFSRRIAAETCSTGSAFWGHGDVYAASAQNATAHAGGSALRLRCGYAEEVVGTGDATSLESSGRLGAQGKGHGFDMIWWCYTSGKEPTPTERER